MQEAEKPSETTEKSDAMDTEAVRHILRETAEDIAPVSPLVFTRIEQSINESSLPGTAQNATSISPLRALLNGVHDYFNKPQLAWGIVAVQTIALCLFVVFSPLHQNSYQTLSADQTGLQSPAAPTFYVMFHDKATIQEIQGLLTRMNAVIINGPGKRGIYTLQLSQSPAIEAENIKKWLNNSPIITFIEKVY